MKNIQILREIIEAIEKHSEFEVKNFDSNTTAAKNDEEIFFNIKFCLRKKEIIGTISEAPVEEIVPGPGPKENEQLERIPAKTSPEEPEKISEPCCPADYEPPKKKKRGIEKKKCVDCANCYNDDKTDELKCCKGHKNEMIISEYTSATFCDDYFAK